MEGVTDRHTVWEVPLLAAIQQRGAHTASLCAANVSHCAGPNVHTNPLK